jgi:hypothetical protein
VEPSGQYDPGVATHAPPHDKVDVPAVVPYLPAAAFRPHTTTVRGHIDVPPGKPSPHMNTGTGIRSGKEAPA